MRRRMMWPLLTAVVIALGAVSCVKDPLNDLTAEDSRIYITNFDSTADFTRFKTFRVSDSVAVVSGNKASRALEAADLAYINAVKKYMLQRGYREVASDSTPDLGVNVNRIYNTSTGVISYPDYWGYYGGYWDPFYWGYGGYGYYIPYSYAIYQITEGAFSVDMLDLKDAPGKNTINVIWTGLVRGSGILNASVADAQIKALFDQSAYIHAGNN
ncbi:hypothetical protein HNQ91_005035 [Filimonas zeae]|nr:DUF4136 domain-containing protein [Filimonas zeae]MDR6341958.1 hypothetical protein [Filimonas zeae]